MKNKDVFVGMKVVPFRKTETAWGAGKLSASFCWARAKRMGQPYLYALSYDKEERAWVLGEENGDSESGDFFKARDFRPYEPTV